MVGDRPLMCTFANSGKNSGTSIQDVKGVGYKFSAEEERPQGRWPQAAVTAVDFVGRDGAGHAIARARHLVMSVASGTLGGGVFSLVWQLGLYIQDRVRIIYKTIRRLKAPLPRALGHGPRHCRSTAM